jgi:hypothetical protein
MSTRENECGYCNTDHTSDDHCPALDGKNEAHGLTDEVAALGYESSDLDEFVHEAAAELAADVNNSGVYEQVEFLLERGWTRATIISELVKINS